MKIELMKLIASKINDVDLIKELMLKYDKMSEETVRKLLYVLKKYNYNHYIFDLVLDSNVLEYRTIEDQIKLMNILSKNNYNDIIFEMILDPDLLKNTTVEDQISLIN